MPLFRRSRGDEALLRADKENVATKADKKKWRGGHVQPVPQQGTATGHKSARSTLTFGGSDPQLMAAIGAAVNQGNCAEGVPAGAGADGQIVQQPVRSFVALAESGTAGMLAFKRGDLVYVRFSPPGGLWEGYTEQGDEKQAGW